MLLARGWSPRRVALVCYGITFALAVGGWFGVRGGLARSLVIVAAGMCALLVAAIRLGALRRTSALRGHSKHAHSIGKKNAGSPA